tara:strand:- start:773 stop:1471 length:699 start_codon:yes stop_codon:yes gene_type:complete
MKSKLKKNKDIVVCIVAHPDDEALGVGGTLIKHAKRGDDVYIIIMSEGESAKSNIKDLNQKRKIAAKKWADYTGCILYRHYDLPDQKFDTISRLETIKILESDLLKIKPDIVYTHHPNDLNIDHKITSEIALTALRPMSKVHSCRTILSIEIPSSSDQAPQMDTFIFCPNHYVSIKDVWDIKKDSLKFYKKELRKSPHPRSIKSINSLAIKRGAESGLEKAEAFTILRNIIK